MYPPTPSDPRVDLRRASAPSKNLRVISFNTIDEPRERMRVQALFTTLRPLMLLGGPSIGGVVGAAFGWRNLMRALSVWGALTIPLVLLLPESLPPPADRPKRRAQCNPVCTPLVLLCPGLDCTKLKRMVRAD